MFTLQIVSPFAGASALWKCRTCHISASLDDLSCSEDNPENKSGRTKNDEQRQANE